MRHINPMLTLELKQLRRVAFKGGRCLIVAVFVLFVGRNTEAGQLTIFVGGAMTEPVKEVDGNRSSLTTGTSGALQNKLRSGEKADVIIVAATTMDELEKEKRIAPGTRIDLARALIGVSMKAGAKAPDLSSVDAFKKAMLAAKSIAYVDPNAGGTLGAYIAGLFQKMGIAGEMHKKTIYRNEASELADAVAKGDAEFGITFTSEMPLNKGVKLAGRLPDPIQRPTIYSGAVLMSAPDPAAARVFLRVMSGSAGLTAMKKAGLEPLLEK
jgi:molybdate transport system substrate-binding protein